MDQPESTLFLLGRAQGAINALEKQAERDRATNAAQFVAINSKFDGMSRHLETQDGKLDALLEQSSRAAGRADQRAEDNAALRRRVNVLISIAGVIAALLAALLEVPHIFPGL